MPLTWKNKTPFAVGSLVGAGPKGGLHLSVIVKGTFSIQAGKPAEAAPESLPVWTIDQFPDDDPARSVRFESDLIPYKPRCDVILVGSARAPEKKPVTELVVGLRIGTMAWAFRVVGDRTWSFPSRMMLTPSITPPKPFVEMPLVYERAYGGVDVKGGGLFDQNPAGVGFLAKGDPDIVDGKRLPNLEGFRDELKSWNHRIRPVGFGYYGRHWVPRLSHLGLNPENGVPKGSFRFDYYNAAHPELQVDGFLRGDEDVEMRNLTSSGVLRFKLPGVKPAVSVTRSTPSSPDHADVAASTSASGDAGPGTARPVQSKELVSMNLDTVCFVPDEEKLYLVWRGLVPVSDLTASDVEIVHVISSQLASKKATSLTDFKTTALVTRRGRIGDTSQVVAAMDFDKTCRLGPRPEAAAADSAGAAPAAVPVASPEAPPAAVPVATPNVGTPASTPAVSAPAASASAPKKAPVPPATPSPIPPPPKPPRAPGARQPIVLLPEDVESPIAGESSGAADASLLPGYLVFDGFRLVKEIGRGRKGVVWLARDEKIGKDVALKFVSEILSRDEKALEDLKREVRNSLGLAHPNILRVFGFHEGDGMAGISMEYVVGQTLARLRDEKPGRFLEPKDIVGWLRQICEALIYAHTKAKLVHRDLRPSNVMLSEAGEIKIKSFGISRRITDSQTRLTQSRPEPESLAYVSPQQILGGGSRVKDDVYGWGATVYDLLTGTPPYLGDPVAGVSKGAPPAVSERRRELGIGREPVPEAWEALIRKCLSHKPEDRPESVAEILERLSSRESLESSAAVPAAGSLGAEKTRTIEPPATQKSDKVVDAEMTLALETSATPPVAKKFDPAETVVLEKPAKPREDRTRVLKPSAESSAVVNADQDKTRVLNAAVDQATVATANSDRTRVLEPSAAPRAGETVEDKTRFVPDTPESKAAPQARRRPFPVLLVLLAIALVAVVLFFLFGRR